MSAKDFSLQEDEMLIAEVRKYPQIFNSENKDSKNLKIREKSWSRISKILKKDGKLCRSRWKNIRDNYAKHNRRKKLGLGNSERTTKWPLLHLLDFLNEPSASVNSTSCNTEGSSEPSISANENGNIQYDFEDDSSTTSFLYSESEQSASKLTEIQTPDYVDLIDIYGKETPACGILGSIQRGRTSTETDHLEERSKERLELMQNSQSEKQEDDLDLFMRSIAMTVKKMTPSKICLAKMKILQAVTELQFSPD
ncbi:unnamed protein product [Ceutorhynchus assimilis]|uniref:Transcription factor Adf-1 n=1 Tax=Ceutorhynchus assimilis TaxID=467358 RepID=A0A9N9QQT3_9CUCU|nr:unnamed protein product [Ceutorhynchus assimilis]